MSPVCPDDAPASALRRNLPNALTMLRLALAAVFFLMLEGHSFRLSPRYLGFFNGSVRSPAHPDAVVLIAAAIFILAAITDAFDGILARRWRVVSSFGRIMDPFADKILVLGAFVLLAGPGFWVPKDPTSPGNPAGLQVTGVAPWMVVAILGRELLVTSLRGVMESRSVDFSATAAGKFKMVLQSVCVPLVLLIVATGNPLQGPDRAVIHGTVWLTVAVSVWSGVPYVLRAIRAGGPAA